MSRNSSSAAPLSRNGRGAVAVCSSTDQPMPRPTSTRPPLAASRLAKDLASLNGMCSGGRTAAVPSLTWVVTAAAVASVMNGSATAR
jgi:hypothetical protein